MMPKGCYQGRCQEGEGSGRYQCKCRIKKPLRQSSRSCSESIQTRAMKKALRHVSQESRDSDIAALEEVIEMATKLKEKNQSRGLIKGNLNE